MLLESIYWPIITLSTMCLSCCFCEVEIESQSWGTTEGAKKATRVLTTLHQHHVVDMTLDTRDLRRNNGVVIDNEEVDASILTDARSEILIRGRILQRRDSEDCYII